MPRFHGVTPAGQQVDYLELARQQKRAGLWKGWHLDFVAAELRRVDQNQRLEQVNQENGIKDGDIVFM